MAWWYQTNKAKPVILNTFIAGYLIGYLFFFTCIEFGVTTYDNIFFLWNNVFYGSLGAFTSLYAVGNKEVQLKVKWPFRFSLIMYVWELVVYFTKIDVNNHWAVMGCFIALVFTMGFLMYNDLKKVRKKH